MGGAVFLTPVGDRVNPVENPLAHRRESDAAQLRVDPEFLRVLLFRVFGDGGRVHEHLRGNAPDVEAGPAENVGGAHAAVNIDDGFVGEFGAREGIA